MKRFIWLPALIGALLLSAVPVLADFYVVAGRPSVGTRITSLPYTISAPGYYFLIGNLSYTGGDGIIVNSPNVTIDLMGFTLTGANIFTYYSGVRIDNQNNVEVRNGTLTGWYIGVREEASGSHHRVIGIRAVGNFAGIYLLGTDHLIKGCTVFPGSFGTDLGMRIGSKGTISGCLVGNFDIGIYHGGDGTISGNVVSDCAETGIYTGSAGGAAISHNQVSNCHTGIHSAGGGSIIGNVVSAGSGQTGITPSTDVSRPNVVDQNNVSGAGTHYGPGSAATIWGANGGR